MRTQPIVRLTGPRRWTLWATIYDEEYGSVPAYFKTDFASVPLKWLILGGVVGARFVPMLPWAWAQAAVYGILAFIILDFPYRNQTAFAAMFHDKGYRDKIGKWKADWMFYKLLRREGLRWHWAVVFYLSVLLFGRLAYSRPQLKD